MYRKGSREIFNWSDRYRILELDPIFLDGLRLDFISKYADQEIHWIVRRSRVHIFFSVDVFRYSCVCRTLIQFRIIWKWNTIISNWTNSLSYRRFIHTYIRMSCPQTRGSTPAPSTKPNSSESSSSSLSARPSSSLSMPFQKLFYTFF